MTKEKDIKICERKNKLLQQKNEKGEKTYEWKNKSKENEEIKMPIRKNKERKMKNEKNDSVNEWVNEWLIETKERK